MQGQATGLAGDAPSQGEEASAQGLGGDDLLAQTDARGPAGQIVSDYLDGQPGAVGGEAPRGEVIETHAVFEITDGILDLGVARIC